MNCRESQSLIGEYALGMLDEKNRLAIEEHLELSGCEACLKELEATQQALASLIRDEPLLTPPERLKDAISARLSDTRVVPSPIPLTVERSKQRRWNWHYVTAAGLAAVALGWGVTQWSRLDGLRPGDQALMAWRKQIEGVDHNLGLIGTRLVGLPLDEAEHTHLAYVVVDQVSRGVHVWTRAFEPGGKTAAPNHAWLLNPAGEVVGKSRLALKGDRLAGVVPADELRSGFTYRLLLTHESDAQADSPKGNTIDSAELLID